MILHSADVCTPEGIILDEDEYKRPEPEKITKLEGAERLLKAAIRLFFEEGDMLAVHSLAAAAHEVLRNLLAKNNQTGSFIKDNDYIAQTHAKEYYDHMNRPHNFLKHADRDPDGVLDFYQDATPFWILDGIGMYIKLTGNMRYKVFLLFFAWFAQQYPRMLKQDSDLAHLVERFARESIISKRHFAEIIGNPDLLDAKAFV
ncbi:hypothetical protein [Nitrospira moscoviensis]|uniref:Uncharacterized protein n=1 Tax=Nitrospira moscoviensis TaxID=42253 RepID=A0A0K2GGW1_NITMO|nr:hypothetical protein [Nitrospira moscoviensis]ALA60203.1 hypothetical protein NITMOv2_3813 [Nitrospira moscoviensis]